MERFLDRILQKLDALIEIVDKVRWKMDYKRRGTKLKVKAGERTRY